MTKTFPTEIIANPELGFLPGDVVIASRLDRRWWRRFLYWIVCKGKPVTKTTCTVVSSNSDTFTVTEENGK